MTPYYLTHVGHVLDTLDKLVGQVERAADTSSTSRGDLILWIDYMNANRVEFVRDAREVARGSYGEPDDDTEFEALAVQRFDELAAELEAVLAARDTAGADQQPAEMPSELRRRAVARRARRDTEPRRMPISQRPCLDFAESAYIAGRGVPTDPGVVVAAVVENWKNHQFAGEASTFETTITSPEGCSAPMDWVRREVIAQLTVALAEPLRLFGERVVEVDAHADDVVVVYTLDDVSDVELSPVLAGDPSGSGAFRRMPRVLAENEHAAVVLGPDSVDTDLLVKRTRAFFALDGAQAARSAKYNRQEPGRPDLGSVVRDLWEVTATLV